MALALCMVFGSVAALPEGTFITQSTSITATAEGDPIVSGDYSYVEIGDGKIEIVAYSGTDTEVTVPTTIDDKTVTSIGDRAFAGTYNLQTIFIGGAVTSIGLQAFCDCKKLEMIYLENNVLTTVGIEAFRGCSSLNNLFFPDSVTEIGADAFLYCTSLESIKIPSGVTQIDNGVFSGCTNLKEVSLPDTLTSIGYNSFEKCESLESIKIPDSVTSIWNAAFRNCPNLKAVTIPKAVSEIGEHAFGYYSDSDEDKKVDGFKISCYNDTAGEQYAKDNGFDYELLDVEHVAAVAATCTVDGNIEHWTCGEMIYSDAVADTEITKEDTVDKAKGHKFPDNWTVTKPASVATPGIKTQVCTVCGGKEEGGTKTETIAKLSKDRVYGTNRFETSRKIAAKIKEENSSAAFQNVIIASGSDFADALSASYLAKVKNAPILLVAGKSASVLSSTVDYVKKNAVANANVYIVGGTSVVPDSLIIDLKKAGCTVKRISGKNRYETNISVLKEAGVKKEELLIASGADYADALSASAVGKPILLVAGKTNSLTDSQKAYLASLKKADSTALSKAYIIGGTGAVSTGIEKQVKSLFKSTERVKGNNRYETSVAVAKRFFNNPKTLAIAYGLNYPDGLCGGPLAMAYNCPLILTVSQKTDAAAAYAKSVKADSAIALGGTTLITDAAIKAIIGK